MSASRYQKVQTLHMFCSTRSTQFWVKRIFKAQIEGGCTKALLG